LRDQLPVIRETSAVSLLAVAEASFDFAGRFADFMPAALDFVACLPALIWRLWFCHRSLSMRAVRLEAKFCLQQRPVVPQKKKLWNSAVKFLKSITWEGNSVLSSQETCRTNCTTEYGEH
jgi:hypothetical protein